MASIAVVHRGSTLLGQHNPCFEDSDLLSLHIFVHALSLQLASARAFAGT